MTDPRLGRQNPFAPGGLSENFGFRAPEFRSLDPADPALRSILDCIFELVEARAEITKETVDAAVKIGRTRHERALRRGAPRPRTQAPGWVYYIRRGDLIKIGTTVNLHARMRDLLPDEVLAVEPGDPGLEKKRHRTFREQLVPGQREWFRSSRELLDHIAAIRAEHGAPDSNLPTMHGRSLRT